MRSPPQGIYSAGKYGTNFHRNRFGIGDDEVIREPQDSDAVRCNPFFTLAVSFRRSGRGVRLAINFHGEAVFDAEEVEDVWAERVLTPEIRAHELPVSQELP